MSEQPDVSPLLQALYEGRTADADREAAIYRDLKARKREQAVIPMPEPNSK